MNSTPENTPIPPTAGAPPTPSAPASLPASPADLHRQRRIFRLLHRLDLLIGLLVILAILLGASIWRTPPLIPAHDFHATATCAGQPLPPPAVYKLLGLPQRFYIRLPEIIDNRYQWFSVDMRQETVTLLPHDPATATWFNLPAIRRTDRLGLDLEFRTLAGLEWTIAFTPDRVSFTNGRLTLTLTPL